MVRAPFDFGKQKRGRDAAAGIRHCNLQERVERERDSPLRDGDHASKHREGERDEA